MKKVVLTLACVMFAGLSARALIPPPPSPAAPAQPAKTQLEKKEIEKVKDLAKIAVTSKNGEIAKGLFLHHVLHVKSHMQDGQAVVDQIILERMMRSSGIVPGSGATIISVYSFTVSPEGVLAPMAYVYDPTSKLNGDIAIDNPLVQQQLLPEIAYWMAYSGS